MTEPRKPDAKEAAAISEAFEWVPSVVPAPLVGPILTLLHDDRVNATLRYAFAEAVFELAKGDGDTATD